jgi:hypothetical protein
MLYRNVVAWRLPIKALARFLSLALALLPLAVRPASSADQLQSCKTDVYEPRSSDDTDHTVGITGPFTRVEFRSAYTLVGIASFDNQELCAILPPRSELERLQVDIAALKPEASITLVAFKHRTDMQRIMAYSLQPGPGVRGIQLQSD